MSISNLRKYTANYANTNHNFVIQNLLGDVVAKSKYYPTICVVKNIIQRGKPTLMSKFLQSKIGEIHKFDDFKKNTLLISKEINKWERIIRGKDEEYFVSPRRHRYGMHRACGKRCAE